VPYYTQSFFGGEPITLTTSDKEFDGIFHSVWVFRSSTSLIGTPHLDRFGAWQNTNCDTYVGWYGGLF